MATRYDGGKDLRAQQAKVAAITALTALCTKLDSYSLSWTVISTSIMNWQSALTLTQSAWHTPLPSVQSMPRPSETLKTPPHATLQEEASLMSDSSQSIDCDSVEQLAHLAWVVPQHKY
eukprot:5532895-Amphidinium_carterae.1